MPVKKRKICIVGAGSVGAATAACMITQGVCDDVVLIDLNHERASAEALDLRNSIDFLNRNVHIYADDYSACSDADIVVVTAAAPFVKGQTRPQMLSGSVPIIRSVTESVMKSGFSGHFILVTNPVDALSYYVCRLSGLPSQQVIGTGTSLDSARLKCVIGELISVDPRSINAYTMGEHGDSQMIPWSCIRIGGKSFDDVMNDNAGRMGYVTREEMLHRTAELGWVIIDGKGSSNYAIAASATGIAQAILFNEHKIIPVSTFLDGEYGEENVYAGVPAVICREGVKEVVEMQLTDMEKQAFHNSVSEIKKVIDKLPL